MAETTKLGKRGTLVVPAAIRRRFGLEEGSLVLVEEREDGILIRPAVALPVEQYTPERRAEFLQPFEPSAQSRAPGALAGSRLA